MEQLRVQALGLRVALSLLRAGWSQGEFTTPQFQKTLQNICYFWDKLVQGDIAEWKQVAAGNGQSPGAATLHGGVVRTLFQQYLNFNLYRLMVSSCRYHRSKLTVEISSGCENGH